MPPSGGIVRNRWLRPTRPPARSRAPFEPFRAEERPPRGRWLAATFRFDQFREPPFVVVLVLLPGDLSVGRVDQPKQGTQVLLVDLGVTAFRVDQRPALGSMEEGVHQKHLG